MSGTVVAVIRDLLLASRIEAATRAAARDYLRVDEPAQLPPPDRVGLVIVAWDERRAEWADQLRSWSAQRPSPPRIILFGPHTDLTAHADARAADLGPMLARSKLVASLAELLARPA